MSTLSSIDISLHTVLCVVGGDQIGRKQFIADTLAPAMGRENLVVSETVDQLHFLQSYVVVLSIEKFSSDLRLHLKTLTDAQAYNLEWIYLPPCSKADRRILSNLGKDKKHPAYSSAFRLVGLAEMQRCTLDSNREYFVIGDIHECVDELKQLLENVGYSIVNNTVTRTDSTMNTDVVLVGDMLDKGRRTVETLNFIYHNFIQTDIFRLITGNHERAVYNLLTDSSKRGCYTQEFINSAYNSYNILKDDDDAKEKFKYLLEQSTPFLKHPSFIVTHSPCADHHLGKLDSKSIRQQIYLPVKNGRSVEETVRPFLDTKFKDYPLHICGHVALSHEYDGTQYGNNKLYIDTGCIHGNRLTGVLVGATSPRFYSVDFLNRQELVPETLLDFRT